MDGKKLKPGLYYHAEEIKEKETISTDEWICSPISIKAITSTQHGSDFGRLLHFMDSNGKWHDWAMPMHMLKGYGDELRGELLSQGLTFNHKRRNLITDYIMSERPKQRVIAANTIGWHGNTFVLPNQIIGFDIVVFQSETAGECDFQTSGSIDEWKENIGTLCDGNIPLMIGIATSLAGPLLKLLNRQQGGAIHLIGDSSSGKSTAVEISTTIWGPPEFIRSWSATANGLEGVASSRNDTCLMLEEISEASPHEVGKIVYMLMNGAGKQRAGKTGHAKKIQRWRLMAISSGEKTLESILKDIGYQINAGQIVRLLNIPARFEHGIFSNLHGFADGRSLADHLKSVRLKYYGQIGPAFIRKLIDEKRDLPDMLDKITKKFIENINENLEKRAATVFAVIGLTGELGIEYNLLPWEKGSALKAAYTAFIRWRKFQGEGQTEDQKILQSISCFINKHGDSRFSTLQEEQTVRDRAGWYKDTEKGRVYLFTTDALHEAGSGYDKNRIIDALVRHQWLVEKDSDRLTKKVRTPSGQKNLYHISILDNEGQPT